MECFDCVLHLYHVKKQAIVEKEEALDLLAKALAKEQLCIRIENLIIEVSKNV